MEKLDNTAQENGTDRDVDQLASLAEQTTQSTCSAVLLTARELIKSHDQKFAIEQIMALGSICEDASSHLETSQNEIGLNNFKGAESSLNQAIDSLMIVSNSALTADITATNLASNDTALFRHVRK
jgi:hypothetical protein